MTANPTTLPPGFEAYKQTPVFRSGAIPGGLLADHSTKAGVWGLLHVTSGQLRYVVTDPRREGTAIMVAADDGPAIIEPEIVHHVEPIGEVAFQITFHRAMTADDAPAVATPAAIWNRRPRREAG